MTPDKDVEDLCAGGFKLAAVGQLEKAIEVFDQVLGVDATNEDAFRGKIICQRIQRDYGAAEKTIKQALSKLPKSVQILNQRGWWHYDQGQYSKAIEVFDQALAVDATNEDALQWKIRALRVQRRFGEARTAIEEALNKLPKSVQILNERGWWHYDQRQYDKAIEVFDQVLAVDATNEDALQWKITSQRMQRNFGAAEKSIEEALGKLPKSVQILNERGWLYYGQRQYDKAIQVFDRVLAADATNEDAFQGKIRALRVQRRLGEADTVIEEALSKLPKSVRILNERGWWHYDQRQYDKAIEVFDRVLAIDATNEDALQWKIASQRMQRNFRAAEKSIEEALSKLPKSVRILNERGWWHYDQGQYDKAIEVFDRVLAVDATNEDALQWKIRALRVQRRFGEAGTAIEEALSKLPSGLAVLNERGWLYYDQQRYDNAVEAFEQTLRVEQSNEDALEWKAISYRAQHDFGAAERAIKEALSKLPKSVRILNQRGWWHYDQGQYDKAIEVFDRVLAIDATNEDALQWKIASQRMQRNFRAAEKSIEEALSKLPKSVRILNEHGRIDYDQDRLDEAERWFAKAIESDPRFLESYFGRVETLNRLNRVDDALRIFQQLRDSRPDDLEVRSKLGWFYLRRNDLVRAKLEFDSIIKTDPSSSIGINGLGAYHFVHRQYEDAEQQFQKLVDMEPSSAVFHTNLAWALVRQDEERYLEEAERHCRTALGLDPVYSDAYGCLGVIAFKRERFLESEDFLQSSVRLNPKKGNYVDLGALYVRMGRYEEAEKQLVEGCRIDTADSRARLELGSLYLQTDRTKKAIRLFREAQCLDPTSEEPPRAMAIALLRAGELSEAEGILRKAIRVLDKPRRWQLHLALSQVLAEMGDKTEDETLHEEALAEVGRAIDLEPKRPEPLFHAGVVRFKLKDYPGAVKFFKRCLDLDPHNFDAERNARLIRSSIQDERMRAHVNLWMGVSLAVVSLLCLAGIWFLYLYYGKDKFVSEATLNVLSPILLGLCFVAFLLPWLNRLKLPGVEAELSQPKEKISKGPMGSVGFGVLSIGSSGQR